MQFLRIITTILGFILLCTTANAQYTEVNVKIDTRQVRENDRYNFESLSRDISQYLENNTFSENYDDLDIYLDIHLIIDSFTTSGNEKKVSAQIIATNQSDFHLYTKNADFPYSKGMSLNFSPMFSPLSSSLDFIAYLFIGNELDTYEYMGGDTYFTKAEDITREGKNSNFARGWDDRKKKVSKIIENNFLRSLRFNFFSVLDNLDSDNVNEKRIKSSLEICFDELTSISEIYGTERNTSLFLSAYGKDLAHLFKSYDFEYAIYILSDVDPDNHTIYSQFLEK
jgi:hypothetical protein